MVRDGFSDEVAKPAAECGGRGKVEETPGLLRFVRYPSCTRPFPLILGGLFLLFAHGSPVAGEAFPTAGEPPRGCRRWQAETGARSDLRSGRNRGRISARGSGRKSGKICLQI